MWYSKIDQKQYQLFSSIDNLFWGRFIILAAINSLETLQSELDLVDIWRIKNAQTRSYTWSQKSPTVLCRLDFWLISNNLCDFINATEIQLAIRTDQSQQ